MKLKEERNEEGEWISTLFIDEFELHDILATLAHIGQEQLVHKIDLQIGGAAHTFVPAVEKRWEERVNALLSEIINLDKRLHDELAYTCK